MNRNTWKFILKYNLVPTYLPYVYLTVSTITLFNINEVGMQLENGEIVPRVQQQWAIASDDGWGAIANKLRHGYTSKAR